MVQTIAEPSGRKSCPPTNINACQGLFQGSSIVSTAYGRLLPSDSLRFEDFGPLCGSASSRVAQGMFGSRGELANELAVDDRRRVEKVLFADAVGEHDLFAMTKEALIAPRTFRQRRLIERDFAAGLAQPIDKAVSSRRELDKAVAPEGVVVACLGIEAGGVAAGPDQTERRLPDRPSALRRKRCRT